MLTISTIGSLVLVLWWNFLTMEQFSVSYILMVKFLKLNIKIKLKIKQQILIILQNEK